jgi:hypothetical protein
LLKLSSAFWAKRETEYLSFIVGDGNVRTSQSKVVAIKDLFLPETQKRVKSFVAFCSFIVHFTQLCGLFGSIDGFEPEIVTRATSTFGYY